MEPLLTLRLLISATKIGLKSVKDPGGKRFVLFNLIQHLLSVCCVHDPKLETLRNVKIIRSCSLPFVHLYL